MNLMPNAYLRLLYFTCTLIAGMNTVASQKYYVASNGSDTNSGTSTSQAWQTIANLNSLQSFGPGDNILFRGGDTFAGRLYVQMTGASNAFCTIGTYGTGPATLTDANSFSNPICEIFNSQYLMVTNLNFIATPGTNYPGNNFVPVNKDNGLFITSLSTNGSKYHSIYVNGCTFKYSASGFQLNVYMVGNDGYDDVEVTNCIFDSVYLLGCYIVGPNQLHGGPVDELSNVYVGYNQFYHIYGDPNAGNQAQPLGVACTTGIVIERNVFGNNCGFGNASLGGSTAFSVSNCRNFLIRYNEVFGTQCAVAFDGSAIDADQDSQNGEICYNLTYSNAGPSIQIGSPTLGTTENIAVHHNISYDDVRGCTTGSVQGALRLYGSTDLIQIFNNDFYVDQSGTIGIPSCVSLEFNNNLNAFFLNNIFKTTGGIPMMRPRQPGEGGENHIDPSCRFIGNCYDSSGGPLRISTNYDVNITNLSGWQAVGEEHLGRKLCGVVADAGFSGLGTFSPPNGGFLPTNQISTVTNFDLSSGSACLRQAVDPTSSVTLQSPLAPQTTDWHGNPLLNFDIGAVQTSHKISIVTGYQSSITFSGYSQAETLTNFPVLVNIGTNISGFAWSQVASTNGYDLRFTDSNTNELPYERNSGTNSVWTNPAGIGSVWVLVPLLNSNTVITAYWGSPALTNSLPFYCESGFAWDNRYSSIWHLEETNSTRYDSTANNVQGIPSGGVFYLTNAEIGTGSTFDGLNGTTIEASASVLPSGTSQRTMSIWFKKTGTNTNVELMGLGANSGAGSRLGLWFGAGSSYFLGVEDAINVFGFNWTNDGGWHNFAYTMTNATTNLSGLQLYLDGHAIGGTGSGWINTANTALSIGNVPTAAGYGRSFDGDADEARVAAVNRSANWIWAEWLNIASNGMFSGYGVASVTGGTNPPAAPSSLTATAASASQINLAWSDNATNATGYVIDRSLDDSTWSNLTVTGPTATNYSDGGLTQNILYYYRVAATNAAGLSAESYVNARTLTAFSAWQYNSAVTFSGYTRTETLTNFPVLVNIGTNISGFAWSQFASTNGFELRFADTNGYELAYEREYGTNGVWTNGAGLGPVWVRVPLLTSNTLITAYWGNAAATNALPAYCTNGAVWTNGYAGVWHLANGQTLSGNDSTTNQATGTIGSGATAATGVVGGGGSFDGTINAYVGLGTLNLLANGLGTASAWINLSMNAAVNSNNYLLAYGKDTGGGTNSWGIDVIPQANGTDSAYLLYGSAQWPASGNSSTALAGTWHLVTAVMASGTQQIFVDGTLVGSGTAATIMPQSGQGFNLGKTSRSPNAYAVNGYLDEARVSTAIRSTNWVWAEWLNAASNTVFNAYGAVTNAPHRLSASLKFKTGSLAWRQSYFTAQQIADATISGDSASPSGDGVVNLLKYAFDLDPWLSAPPGLPVVGQWTDPDTQLRYLTLTYRQNTAALDLVFTPQAASDLTGNTWVSGLPEISRVADNGWDSVTVRDTVPMDGTIQRFLRLNVTRLAEK